MSGDMLVSVLAELFSLDVLLVMLLGVLGGILIGSLPGLSATMAIALLIPVTFSMETIPGLVLLVSVYTAAVYGGSISAILLQTPGTPSSAATSLDGYQMTLKGEGAKALSVATIASVVGGVLSGIALLFVAPKLAQVSLAFGAPEYFMIAVFGLTIVGGLAGKSMAKGIAAAVVGLLLGTIGIDLLTGYPRFTFGAASLEGGISLIPAMIGLFSMAQVMVLVESRGNTGETITTPSSVRGSSLPSKAELRRITPTIGKSSIIGTFVGILPGAGGDIGSWIAYNEAKRSSKRRHEFGKGAIEGVAAPEAANNAVVGGALIPMLTLGIPGSTATAILLGGLIMQGMIPGHELFTVFAVETYSMISGFILATIVMGVIGLLGARYFVKVASVPNGIIAALIVVLSVIGSYAMANNIFDVGVMVAFGAIGYLMKKADIHPAPVILGLILGPIAETGFRQSLIMAADSPLLAFYLQRPITVGLIILTLLTLLAPPILAKVRKKKVREEVPTAGQGD
ncbi:tripartite tricarboxylate transporter permease [Arthrobacter sp. EH-1B-1]|uniref:Tripartite tricarboxylate transporter permease n=1 Tax=Arthrobacter vasquezii TaxID=2977629 RepID=A0ABT6CVS9_9MICC|nr:tripartite tricarboxylate transporter permease [Arthrobacter vasquezii]MDF9277602.1 tripartite tricarboxylate transporter permease [Arthrobacter vasquezii]